jgi:sRNA-binding protein
MKFLSVRDLRNTPGRVWADLRKDDLVVTSNGKPVGILIGVDGEGIEEALQMLRRAKATQAVSRMRKSAARSGAARLSARAIDGEIRASRRARRPA